MASGPINGSPILVTSNRGAILELLCHQDRLSRSEIAERTGISLSTVHRLCTQLEGEGLIIVTEEKRDGRGRPSQLLSFNASSHAVIAMNIRDQGFDGIVMGLNGMVLEERSEPFPEGTYGPDQLVKALTDFAQKLHSFADTRNIPIHGIGVSVPGIIRLDGTIEYSSQLEWTNIPLTPILDSVFHKPLLAENNANAFTYGEWIRGAGQGQEPLIGCIQEQNGVGAGAVCNGDILRGARGGAGEIGYMLASPDALDRLHTHTGDLEELLVGAETETGQRFIDLLALAIANISVAIDPAKVVLRLNDDSATGIVIDKIKQRLIGRIPGQLDIVKTKLGHKAELLGVGEMISRQVRTNVFAD